MPKTILILDDHQLFALGVEAMMQTLPDEYDCVARADVAAALAQIEDGSFQAALFIVDFYMPGTHAPDLITRLRQAAPETPVLVVSGSHSTADRQAALNAGALGFVNKTAPSEHILAAIEDALCGGHAAGPVPANPPLAALGLTDRQFDILVLASKGMTNKEIARMLDISPETVKTHLSAAFRRMNVANRVEAMSHLRAMGLG